MDPHPDFAGVALPRAAALPGFALGPLCPAHLEEDFAAVTASAAILGGLFGDWPAGLTREANALDLAWHEREFTLGRSFSWIVRGRGGDYRGCAYLFPAPGARGRAEVATWLRLGHEGDLGRLRGELGDWFAAVLPPGLDLAWRAPAP